MPQTQLDSPEAFLANLTPIASISNKQEFRELNQNAALRESQLIGEHLISKANAEAFAVLGFCAACNKQVSFLVDMQYGGQRDSKSWTPNWRERLECPSCRMNNRQRLMAALIAQSLANSEGKSVYLMEQVTPIYSWASAHFGNHIIFGSEHLGSKYRSGAVINGIRHEDIHNLSFADFELDLIISNDVLEHVNDPARALAECARTLKKGGTMLATMPFDFQRDQSITRAMIKDGAVINALPPLYHENPMSESGSLVFTDFGWSLLGTMRGAGFSDARVDVYTAPALGHLGGAQFIFRLEK